MNPVDKQLVIFDCDGTLVDSEHLANRFFVQLVNQLGADLTVNEAAHHFVGTSLAFCMSYTADKYGITFPKDFVLEYRASLQTIFRNELQPMPYAKDVLRQLKSPLCVASNGPMEPMKDNLQTTGLLSYFGDHIYSAYTINAWKPDPDLFLHAAAQFEMDPSQCLVIEDSSAGVQAALAAGMDVLHFCPPGHKSNVTRDDITTIEDLRSIPLYLN
ncbi:MAG: HAD-IA family hydrolase [Saprospiraceae bacterium]|nr:HAD-IA family hydrolase [Saprospiraceae bacterium]